jgi:hypothetical protein
MALSGDYIDQNIVKSVAVPFLRFFICEVYNLELL